MKQMCSVKGCDKPAKANGWCDNHYMEIRRKGSVVKKERVSGNAHVSTRVSPECRAALAAEPGGVYQAASRALEGWYKKTLRRKNRGG